MFRKALMFVSNPFFNYCFCVMAEITCVEDDSVYKTYCQQLFSTDAQNEISENFEFNVPYADESLNTDESVAKSLVIYNPFINNKGSINSLDEECSLEFNSVEESEFCKQMLSMLRGDYVTKSVNSIVTIYFDL